MSLLFAIALASTAPPAKNLVSEEEAIDLVAKAMRRIYRDEPLRCFGIVAEDRSGEAFDITVRENHKPGCGGDPAFMPVRDRFRVGRSPLRLWRLDPVQDTYVGCQFAKGRPVCPRLNQE